MRKKICVLLGGLLLVMLTTGWTFSLDWNKDKIAKSMIDDFEAIFVLNNERVGIYENALHVLKDYVETPTEYNLAKAKAACWEGVIEISNLPSGESTLDEKTLAEMSKLGVDLADYMVPFSTFSYNKYRNAETLMNRFYYLNNQPFTYDDLKSLVELSLLELDIERQIDFLGLNGFLIELEKNGIKSSAIENFKQNFLPSLNFLNPAKMPLEKDLLTVEAKIEKLFIDYESIIGNYEKILGRNYFDLLAKQKEFRENALKAGYSDADVDSILKKIEDLSHQYQKEQQESLKKVLVPK